MKTMIQRRGTGGDAAKRGGNAGAMENLEKGKALRDFYQDDRSFTQQQHTEWVKQAIGLALSDDPDFGFKEAVLWLEGQGVPLARFPALAKYAEVEQDDELRARIKNLGAEGIIPLSTNLTS